MRVIPTNGSQAVEAHRNTPEVIPGRAAPAGKWQSTCRYSAAMATLRLFAAAREAAGTGRDVVAGRTVGDVLEQARARYGEGFTEVLATAKVWCNGEPAEPGQPVTDADEIAVLPPVSGGAGPAAGAAG